MPTRNILKVNCNRNFTVDVLRKLIVIMCVFVITSKVNTSHCKCAAVFFHNVYHESYGGVLGIHIAYCNINTMVSYIKQYIL